MVGKVSKLVLFSAVLLSLTLVTASAQVFPTVSFSFDSASYEYSWTVNVTPDSSYPFGQFLVQTQVAGGLTSYSGPVVGSADEGWTFVSGVSGGKLSFYWRASTDQEVMPSPNGWTGVFKVVVPDTQPVPGSVQTKDGVLTSRNTLTSSVPGPVPEPSSLAAFGALLCGMAPLALRKRR